MRPTLAAISDLYGFGVVETEMGPGQETLWNGWRILPVPSVRRVNALLRATIGQRTFVQVPVSQRLKLQY